MPGSGMLGFFTIAEKARRTPKPGREHAQKIPKIVLWLFFLCLSTISINSPKFTSVIVGGKKAKNVARKIPRRKNGRYYARATTARGLPIWKKG